MRVKALVLAAALLPTTSFAETYIGFSVGQGQFRGTELNASGYGQTFMDVEVDIDKSSIAGSLYAGYQFNPFFAIELTAGGIDAINVDSVSVGRMMYVAAAPKVSYPLGRNFQIFGKWGLAQFSAETIINAGAWGDYTTDDSVTSQMFSLGAEYALNNSVAVRVSWDYLRPELELGSYNGISANVATDINIFSAGLNYKF
ncbi:outer membrane beta-barrel protein [Photobacterium lipolyticum]|uniref:Outer membrane protein OmpA-like transmembrane domain-containing protein n=1 Tax=Photobacterium lipolyticum TaxID=266810 RepID=A0A2T3N539_9GAMM|nr:outer membrane beta-barrel protein [Photobacterium lipolyticum]PSW07533.1 hypothetical protein C9I89_02130 [Photobacterium lipolyticum]